MSVLTDSSRLAARRTGRMHGWVSGDWGEGSLLNKSRSGGTPCCRTACGHGGEI